MRLRWVNLVLLLALTLAAPAQNPQAAKTESATHPLEAPSATLPADAANRSRPRLTLPSMALADDAKVPVPRIVLPPLSESEQRAAQSKPSNEMRVRVGITRKIEIVPSGQGIRIKQNNSTDLWMVEATSTGAKMVRLHFTAFNLPDGVKLYLSGTTGADDVAVFEGKGPSRDGDFWSPIVAGETMRLEMIGSSMESATFTVTQVGHVFAAKLESTEAGSCNLDANCYPEWMESGDSVAKIVFNDTQFIYACSAVLLNNNSGDLSPLLLTANHCLSSDALAATLQVFWRYRSFSCGDPQGYSPSIAGPAKVLASTSAADATLLEIYTRNLASSLKWAGWKVEPPTVGEAITGIHHPAGSFQRISFGSLLTDSPSALFFHRVRFSGGTGESGSSGSPLFNAAHQVLGQLYGGTASCSNPSGDIYYGKLGTSISIFQSADGRQYLQQGLPDDTYAPNHQRGAAVALPGAGTYSQLVVKIASQDWFKVRVPAKTLLTASILNSTANLTIEVFRGDSLQPVFVSTNNGESTANEGEEIDYYLHIFGDSPRAYYDLRLILEGVTPPAVFAPAVWPSAPEHADVDCSVNTKFAFAMWAEWDTDPGFGNKMSSNPQNFPGASGGYLIRIPVQHLQPDTIYYFRCLATNSAATVAGPGTQKRTSPLTAPNVWAPGDGYQNVGLDTNAFAIWNGEAPNYDVYYGSNPEPPFFMSTAQKSISLPAYSPDTKYYIRVVAKYEFGTISSPTTSFNTYPRSRLTILNAFYSPLALVWNVPSQVVGRWSTGQSVSFYNNAPDPLTVVGISLDGPFIQTNTCTVTLMQRESCTVTVFFGPSVAGQNTGTLTLQHSFGSVTQLVAGSGIDFTLSLSRPMRPLRSSSAQSQSFELMVAPSQGLNGSVTLNCLGTLPGTTCSLSPSSLLLGSTPLTATVTVATAPHSQRFRSRSKTMHLKVSATVEGLTKSIDLPVQVAH